MQGCQSLPQRRSRRAGFSLGYNPTCACLWALLIQPPPHGLTSDLPDHHKRASNLDSELPPLPHSLAGCGGTSPGWWGPALPAWGVPPAPHPLGSSQQPFLCPDVIKKKKTNKHTKNQTYEFLWLEVGLNYSDFTKHDTRTPRMSSTLLYNFICMRYLQDVSVSEIEESEETVKKKPEDDVTTKKLGGVRDFREINSDTTYVISCYYWKGSAADITGRQAQK